MFSPVKQKEPSSTRKRVLIFWIRTAKCYFSFHHPYGTMGTLPSEVLQLSQGLRREKKEMNFLLQGCAGAFLRLFSLETEYPLFVKEPLSHISAEMEKVVDIPCQARGDCFHLPFFKTYFFSFYLWCFCLCRRVCEIANKGGGGGEGK